VRDDAALHQILKTIRLVPNAPQFDIAADAGTIAARRILQRLHDEETVARPVAAE